MARLDAFLEDLAAHAGALASIKAGDALAVLQQDGGQLACASPGPGGAVVGLVPPGLAPQLRQGGAWTATVRSLKRADGAVTQLQVRLAPGEAPAEPGGHAGEAGRQPGGCLVWAQ